MFNGVCDKGSTKTKEDDGNSASEREWMENGRTSEGETDIIRTKSLVEREGEESIRSGEFGVLEEEANICNGVGVSTGCEEVMIGIEGVEKL